VEGEEDVPGEVRQVNNNPEKRGEEREDKPEWRESHG